jgi:glycyl-tRNA synthetase beta chain
MVKEFTDLQGIIGGLYAREQREDERVATAIYEHYKPLSMEDSIPSTIEGQIVSLADKIDTLNECFTRRMVPTGSKDPFALRRAAQGVVRILVEGQVDFVPDDLFTRELLDFMRERVQYYFREIRGYKYDEVNAVLAAGMAPLVGVEPRLKALSEVRSTENFEPLAASFKRINNILKQSGYRAGRSITEADFLSPAERDLFAELQRVIHAAQEYFGSGEYLKLLQVIASTRPTVDRFFETTMVMDPDQDTRERRLELLYRINQHFNTIADFSEIVTAGDKTN